MASRRLCAALALALTCVALSACGDSAAPGQAPTVVLSLDFVPNAVHAPIYMAVRDGRDREQGIRLQIRKPGSGPDALKLVASGRVISACSTSTTSRSRGSRAPTWWR
jgi:putative hydroxymethylpyrimidine transport system substrate-binding protein